MRKPDYERDGVRLYLADCLEVLPELSGVDCVVTDPPYGLGDKWQGGGGGSHSSWGFSPAEAMSWDITTASGVESLVTFSECVIWGGNYYQLPTSRAWLVWDKKTPDNFTTGQAELAWTNLDIPVRVYRLAQCEQASEGKKYHPTQKPLSLMMWCLKWINASCIVDPFMGSGTTGVACIQTGRNFIGIEKDPTYFAIAVKRIDAALDADRDSLWTAKQLAEQQRELFTDQEP